MRYIFYADVYFLQNFMIKVAVLYLALYCSKVHEVISATKGIGKICLASFIGTIIEIMGLISSSSYSVFILCVHLFEVPLMTWFLLGNRYNKFFRVIVSGYFFMMLVNSVLEVLWNQFGEQGSYIFYLLFSCSTVIVGVRIWKNYTKIRKGIFQVEMLHQGKLVRIKGFYDSGNRLIDPYTGRGVHIVSEQLLRKLGVTRQIIEWSHTGSVEENSVYIPYQALGNENGMLAVYYIDEVIIEGEKGRKIIQNSPVGVTKDNLFEGKNYEIILNEEVF